jgi:hypothetical protein
MEPRPKRFDFKEESPKTFTRRFLSKSNDDLTDHAKNSAVQKSASFHEYVQATQERKRDTEIPRIRVHGSLRNIPSMFTLGESESRINQEPGLRRLATSAENLSKINNYFDFETGLNVSVTTIKLEPLIETIVNTDMNMNITKEPSVKLFSNTSRRDSAGSARSNMIISDGKKRNIVIRIVHFLLNKQ